MCLSQFFGDLSVFQIFISVFALVTGFITLYKSYWEGARVNAYTTDRVGFVISKNGGTTNFQLGINLVNTGVKTGTVHRLEALVTPPAGEPYRFDWSLFYEYSRGGYAVEKTTDPHPLSVAGRNSCLIFIQFAITPTNIPAWPPGRYEFKIIGWVNRNRREEKSNLLSIFHIDLSRETALQLESERPDNPTVVYVPVLEWNR